MDKYCRICWNTSNWRCPSGEARNLEMGESYVSEHGFGHEEWLFNFEWLLPGYNPEDQHQYKYGFLQPINKYRSNYVGETFSVLVYTVNPDRMTMIVACIKDSYVPEYQELEWVLDQTRDNSWLASMQQQVSDLGSSVGPLVNPSPSSISNIRFLPENVTFYDPMILVGPPHKTTRIHRYQPLDWNDGFVPTLSPPDRTIPAEQSEQDDSPDRSETERMRAAQTGTTYDPQHSKLQNRLRRNLQAQYGKNSVTQEREFVDLKLIESGLTTFIEIKMERTVKKCVRLALGQLLEYASYPNLQKADRLLIVGDVFATEDDKKYLRYIRQTFNIPIYYSRWAWVHEELGPWL